MVSASRSGRKVDRTTNCLLSAKPVHVAQLDLLTPQGARTTTTSELLLLLDIVDGESMSSRSGKLGGLSKRSSGNEIGGVDR